MTENLLQALIGIGIVALILLIINLLRLFVVLGDIQDVSRVAKKRVREADAYVEKSRAKINGLLETIGAFMASLDLAKAVRRKVSSFLEKDNQSQGEEDGKK